MVAIVKDVNCSSSASNKVNLLDNTTGSTALAEPLLLIDGKDVSGGGAVTLCEEGSVVLEVCNSSAYSNDVAFEWFANGISLGITNNPTTLYNIPRNTHKYSQKVKSYCY